MQRQTAAMVGGVIAGVVTSVVMFAGRKSGLLTKALDRDAVDWIDEKTGSRAVIGDTGTSIAATTSGVRSNIQTQTQL